MKCINCESLAVRLIPKKHLFICYACGASWGQNKPAPQDLPKTKKQI